MKKKKYSTISIIIPTRKDDERLLQCLVSLRGQTYPQEELEILVSDGGNSHRTKILVENFGGHWLQNDKKLAEPGVSLGMKKAKGDIVMVMATDNEYIDRHALEKISLVFDNYDIAGAFPKHGSSSDDSLFTKYVNIFSDPVTHFLYGDAANARTFHIKYKTIRHTKTYNLYDFSSSSIRPVIAFAQGFAIRRKYIKQRKYEMDDIQPILDLLDNGKYVAYIYDITILHHTIHGAAQFFRKQRWAMRNMLHKKKYGLTLRKNTLTSYQKMKMYIYPFYSLSIIFPIVVAGYKFIKTREMIWLFHPVICFISAIAIGFEYVTITMHKTSFFRT